MYVATARSTQNVSNAPSSPKHGVPKSGHIQIGFEVARSWRPLGMVLADVTSPAGVDPRLAHLNVSFGLLAHPQVPWAARFWEVDAPPGAQPIEWFFGSRASVSCLEDALALLESTQGLVTSYAVT